MNRSAAMDLISAIEKLALEPTLRRHDELMSKGDLNDDERTELKELQRRDPCRQAQGEPLSPLGRLTARLNLRRQ